MPTDNTTTRFTELRGKPLNLRGHKYNLLTALFPSWEVPEGSSGKMRIYWYCLCDCGNIHKATAASLRIGAVKSCGCLHKTHCALTTHGLSRNPIYRTEFHTWQSMFQRTGNPNNPRYSDYGGRGISVGERWRGPRGFEHFIADMGTRPSKKHSLDRINNDGNYEPSNCRWATQDEQSSNKRSNRFVTAFGITKTITQWSKVYGVKGITIDSRLAARWLPEDAVKLPPQKGRRYQPTILDHL